MYQNEATDHSVIYFLLTPERPISHFHKLTKSNETWHFYMGSPITIAELKENGSVKQTRLGNDFDGVVKGEMVPQYLVKSGQWFGCCLGGPDDYTGQKNGPGNDCFALVGCSCDPMFRFRDFAMLTQAEVEPGDVKVPEEFKFMVHP